METNDLAKKIIFRPSILYKTKEYEMQLINKNYTYSMQRSFIEIIEKYKIPFEISEIDMSKTWIKEKAEMPNVGGSILFISDFLNISTYDTIKIIDYLLEHKIIELIVEQKKDLSFIIKKTKEHNQFYKVDYKEPGAINVNQDLTVKDSFFMLTSFNYEFYKKSSHPIKYTIDIFFYFLLNYVRNVEVCQTQIRGSFRGCLFEFVGHKKKSNIEQKIEIVKKYESFNKDAHMISLLDKYEDIKKAIKGNYELHNR